MRVPDAQRWPAPSLEAPTEVLSVRVPADLRENLRTWTTALRRRMGARSHKRLSEQEVATFLLWMLGDGEDPERVAHIEELFMEFRRRRYEVAARGA